jgi:hypothetical protein
MSLWGKGNRVLLFFLLVLLACDDESYLLGFQSPDENFKVVYAEFKLPSTVFQIDSLITSNGSTSSTNRLLVGNFSDSRFGTGSASAYMQFYPTSFPTIADTAVYERISMTLVYDLYHFGSMATSTQSYEFYELADSIVNSSAYYTKSSLPLHPALIGSASRAIDPFLFDDIRKQNNADNNTANDAIDSLNIDLGDKLGLRVFNAIRASDSVSIATYRNFFRWRQKIMGLAMVPVNADKVLGFAPAHAKSRITLYYREQGKTKQITLSISPLNAMASFSNITIDRSGTPVGTITEFYKDYEPADGQRYIHSGSGILTKLDLTPVFDYFENISIKSLNVAELSIVTDEQATAPTRFALRAVKEDNRAVLGIAKGINEAYDSVTYADPIFAFKHYLFSPSSPRADVLGDDGQLFTLDQKSNQGTAVFKGYLTTFLQKEVDLADKDYLTYFSVIPTSPEMGKSVNGFHFHKDSVTLKIFYTTPKIEE